MFEGTEYLDAIRTDSFDGYQPSIHRPLAGAGHPASDGGSTIRSSEAIVGYPVALWQKPTASGDFLKSANASAAERRVVQRGV